MPHPLIEIMNRSRVTRRSVLRSVGMGLLGTACSGWFHLLERTVCAEPTRMRRKKRCIILWMAGGPSQMDTFDMKPNHANGGEFKEIATNVAGLRISEHLPNLAKQADKLAIVRSLQTDEGDHARGTYLVRTGIRPGAPVAYPAIGSCLAKELGSTNSVLPNYLAVDPPTVLNPEAFSAGFLGPEYAATNISGNVNGGDRFATLQIANLTLSPRVPQEQAMQRRELWSHLQSSFAQTHSTPSAAAHEVLYQRAFRMMDSNAAEAFDLSQEPDTLRAAYGKGLFGQGCLLARRLIERNVPLVEVALGGLTGGIGWDTHANNFRDVQRLSAELDAGWATLMTDLEQRGLLEETTILWIGEFGRTPRINRAGGRDHFPNAWSCVLAGGGIRGGQAYGATSPDGMEVRDSPVEIPDLLATLCTAVGVDPAHENYSAEGRPIRIVDNGDPIEPLLA
jgi:hypothetical protein